MCERTCTHAGHELVLVSVQMTFRSQRRFLLSLCSAVRLSIVCSLSACVSPVGVSSYGCAVFVTSFSSPFCSLFFYPHFRRLLHCSHVSPSSFFPLRPCASSRSFMFFSPSWKEQKRKRRTGIRKTNEQRDNGLADVWRLSPLGIEMQVCGRRYGQHHHASGRGLACETGAALRQRSSRASEIV